LDNERNFVTKYRGEKSLDDPTGYFLRSLGYGQQFPDQSMMMARAPATFQAELKPPVAPLS